MSNKTNKYFKNEDGSPKYDPNDRQSVVQHLKKLEGKTLREVCHSDITNSKNSGKGRWGHLLEEFYLGYTPNNKHEPDFEKLGIEIKSTGIINKKVTTKKDGTIKIQNFHRYIAKERISVAVVNFDEIISKSFEEVFWNKIKDTLYVLHKWEKDKKPIDFEVAKVSFYKFSEFEKEELYNDWLHIRNVVMKGRAEDLTGRSAVNLFLEPATTGEGHGKVVNQPNGKPAKPRRYALSPGFASLIVKRILEERI